MIGAEFSELPKNIRIGGGEGKGSGGGLVSIN